MGTAGKVLQSASKASILLTPARLSALLHQSTTTGLTGWAAQQTWRHGGSVLWQAGLHSAPNASPSSLDKLITASGRCLRQQWQAVELSWSTAKGLAAGLTLGATGQKLLIGLLPIAISSQLFPSRFVALARAAPCPHTQRQPAYMISTTTHPHLFRQLLNKTGIPILMHQIYNELLIWARAVYLGFLFLPAIASAPVAFWAGGSARAAWLQLMTWTLENAGPAFIKWGQWSSTRPDLFAPDLCQAMERLQTSAPVHAPSYTHHAVSKSLGHSVKSLFDEFDDEPVASGSIAQIHRAVLSAEGAAATQGRYPAGTCVAVKVRHPGVTQLMAHDFELMERAVKVLSAIPAVGRLRLDESIRQFGGPLKEQLDLVCEARHLARFKHNFRLWPNVSFPAPIYPLVSSDVLVETFEDGALISKYVNQPTYKHRVQLAETGLTCYLQMLLRDNFIHADLHPGNILVKEADSHTQQIGGGWLGWIHRTLLHTPPKLVLLDVGMIAELSKSDQANLVAFFKALTKQDGEVVGHAILDMSERYTCKDPEAFVRDVKSLFDKLDPEYISRHTSRVMESVIDTVREHQVTLRSAVSTVVVTTLVLEGWSSKLNPDMRILDFMRDMLLVDWNERISRTVDNIMGNGSLAVV